jgi:hypothetical protein
VAAVENFSRETDLASVVGDRLRGADGLRVTGSGTLAQANGHPAGTPWVEIEADSVLDCDVAEFRLSRLDVLTPARWEQGWSLAENPRRELCFRLQLFASA